LASRMARFKGKLDAALLPVLPTSAVSGVAQAALLAFSSVLERRWTDTGTLIATDDLPCMQVLTTALERRWTDTAMFFTFLETERLAADAAALVAAAVAAAAETGEPSEVVTGGEGLERSFERLLDSQAVVMTVRGTVREDFLTSRGLSRV